MKERLGFSRINIKNTLSLIINIMIALNSRARKRRKVKREYRRSWGRRRGMLTAGYGATQSATCCTMCKEVELGLGTRGLKIVAAF